MMDHAKRTMYKVILWKDNHTHTKENTKAKMAKPEDLL